MKTEAIVAASGIGKRLKAKVRKPYLKLAGRPILVHTLQALSHSEDINNIIVVVNRLDREKCAALIKRYNIKKIKAVVAGGRARGDSVYNGLCRIDKDADIVLIHDGVRPFIDGDIIRRSVECAVEFGACVVGVPVKATIKKTKERKNGRTEKQKNGKTFVVKRTIDRSNLWEIQTPQAFRKDIILRAYKRYRDSAATDDSMLVERLGVEVRVIMGSYRNIKITTAEDLIVAEAICKNLMTNYQ